MSRYLSALVFLASVSLLAAQQTPAITPAGGSNASIQVSNGPGPAFQFTKDDLKLLAESNAIDSEFEEKDLVLHDPGVQAYVDAVGKRMLANRATPDKVTYRFLVLRDPEVNAFSLANGSVYVTTGLLGLLKNEAQLAGVLSHETSHVYERHAYLENRSIGNKNLAMEIIAAAGPLGTRRLCQFAGGIRSRRYFADSGRVGLRLFPRQGAAG